MRGSHSLTRVWKHTRIWSHVCTLCFSMLDLHRLNRTKHILKWTQKNLILIFPHICWEFLNVFHMYDMIPLILIHHVIGKQRYLRDEHSLIVPNIYEYARTAENFKVTLKQIWTCPESFMLLNKIILIKLSTETFFEENKNLNEFLNVSMKCYLISLCWEHIVILSNLFYSLQLLKLRQSAK